MSRKLPSKIHSCSELGEGGKKVLEMKQEGEDEADLRKKIQACSVHALLQVSIVLSFPFILSWHSLVQWRPMRRSSPN